MHCCDASSPWCIVMYNHCDASSGWCTNVIHQKRYTWLVICDVLLVCCMYDVLRYRVMNVNAWMLMNELWVLMHECWTNDECWWWMLMDEWWINDAGWCIWDVCEWCMMHLLCVMQWCMLNRLICVKCMYNFCNDKCILYWFYYCFNVWILVVVFVCFSGLK